MALTASSGYASARDVTRGVAELVRPPRRIRPSEAAGKYLRNDKGPWTADVAPMMLEPLDLLGGREYTGIVLVGPQRGGKTFGLIHAGMNYAVTCAPGDAMIVQMSQDVARDFSRMEVDRVIRYSPELAEQLSPRARDDNTYDKFFRSGMVLKLAWPSINQLSGKTLKYVLIPDYDRPENRDNVDGEGSVWDLAFKRIQTYMSRGKCLAESSPGEPLLEPRWMPKTPHEAPPVRGILELYNRGTRARWHWPCIHCGAYWEPKPGLSPFVLPELKELEQLVQREDLMSLAARFARVVCPHCGAASDMSHKRDMNVRGKWVHEGETLNADGTRSGQRRSTPFASYWFGGAAASHQRWDSLLYSYFQALLTYVRTGDEQPLQFTTSSDQAAPYIPRAAGKRRTPEELVARIETWERGFIPAGVRFLTAAVDVQAHRFVVQVMGWPRARVVDRRAIQHHREQPPRRRSPRRRRPGRVC
jgi:phage terminase large subunit GpA-like protein